MIQNKMAHFNLFTFKITGNKITQDNKRDKMIDLDYDDVDGVIKKNKILGIIPARGGSKGIPRKNLKELAGKPLIAWTIQEALKSRCLDRLILSSDDGEIIRTAKDLGCEAPFIRPGELAGDDVPGIAPVLHALDVIGKPYDYVVLLQPTSPLRTAGDIDGCIRHCIQKGAPACVSVSPADQNPYWMHTLDQEGRLRPFLRAGKTIDRRQDLPPLYIENGAVYVAKTCYIRKEKNFITGETLAYIMPPERSLDIDTPWDFLLCELLKSQNIFPAPGQKSSG